ncbi:MAG: hypothetical protein U7126_28375 [Microcoleus sp.]
MQRPIKLVLLVNNANLRRNRSGQAVEDLRLLLMVRWRCVEITRVGWFDTPRP